MNVTVIQGDLLDQDVDVIVNAWNRNIIPWWLLLPQGVSGAIKKRGGTGPFKELRKHGPIPLGGAVLTSAGTAAFQGDHPRRRDQHALAGVRAVDSGFGPKRHGTCRTSMASSPLPFR